MTEFPAERLATAEGRRMLRAEAAITPEQAAVLLGFEDDFTVVGRDPTLANVVNVASIDDLHRHATAILAGPGAGVLLERLQNNPEELREVALEVVSGEQRDAAEATLYLLVIDHLDPYQVGDESRTAIASAGLDSQFALIRSLSAEYLFDSQLGVLAERYQQLVLDEDERVRGVAWSAGIQVDTARALQLTYEIVNDGQLPLQIRRSALAAAGTHLETRDVVDLLAEYVGHEELDLALDAANLLYRYHRHPTIAEASARSQHAEVREIGEFLLDPYRGSPAAGGSRPGDPTHSDVFAEMIRQTEERLLDGDER